MRMKRCTAARYCIDRSRGGGLAEFRDQPVGQESVREPNVPQMRGGEGITGVPYVCIMILSREMSGVGVWSIALLAGCTLHVARCR